MEDLSKDMRPKKTISPKMRALLDKEKLNARMRIVERGIVHFRADKEFMETLFSAAETLKTAPGTLCRQIVWEYLKTIKPSRLSYKNTRQLNETLIQKLELIEDEMKQIQSYLAGRGSGEKSNRGIDEARREGNKRYSGALKKLANR